MKIKDFNLNEYKELYSEEFDGIKDFIKELENRDYAYDKENSPAVTGYVEYPHFTGVGTYEEYETLLNNGYNVAIEEIKKIQINHTKNKQKSVYDMAGYTPCVPRAIQGHPQSMVRKIKIAEKPKSADIVINISAPALCNSEDYLEAGKKIVTFLNNLEDKNIKTNLYISFMGEHNNQISLLTVKIKSAGQNINPARLSFLLCHVAFMRLGCFEWYRKTEKIKHSKGYGTPVSGKRADDVVKKIKGRNAKSISIYDIIKKTDYLDSITI